MIDRLENALAEGQPVTGADRNFYNHELTEADLMGSGMSYDDAHQAALEIHDVSPFSLYAPEVVESHPEIFNGNWFDYWGIPRP